MDARLKLKTMASELLGLYVLLRHWVFTVVAPQPIDLTREIAAFEASCKVVDLILTLKRGYSDQSCSPECFAELRAAIGVSIRLHIEAYGTGSIRPKHHRMLHIPEQIQRRKWVVDAFIIERIHLVVKESFAYVNNPTDFEASLLRGSTLRQIERLKEKTFFGLIGVKVPLRGFPGSVVAKQLHFEGMSVSVGDVVLRDVVVGKVLACAEEDSGVFVLVEVWEVVCMVTPHSHRCVTTDHVQAWPIEHVSQAAAWYEEGAQHVVVLTE